MSQFIVFDITLSHSYRKAVNHFLFIRFIILNINLFFRQGRTGISNWPLGQCRYLSDPFTHRWNLIVFLHSTRGFVHHRSSLRQRSYSEYLGCLSRDRSACMSLHLYIFPRARVLSIDEWCQSFSHNILFYITLLEKCAFSYLSLHFAKLFPNCQTFTRVQTFFIFLTTFFKKKLVPIIWKI